MKHRLSKTGFSLLFVLPSLVTLGMAAGIMMGPPLMVLLISLIFLALFWYEFMTVPFEFKMQSDGFILFRSVARSLNLPINDIIEIDARPWNRGFIFFRYNHRKVTLFRNTPGMKDLIKSIQTLNPSTILSGDV